MSSTMLQLVQQAAGELGIPQPTAVAGSASTDTIQQLSLLNAVGNDLARQFDWQSLVTQYLVTVSSTSITGDTTLGSSTMTGIASTAGIDATYQISGAGLNQATYVAGVPGGTSLTLSQPATSSNTAATYTLGKVKYSMPSDYDRQINRTHWDKSKHWEMLGPETAQQWEWLISGYISTGPRIRYRIFGDYFQTWPIITTSDTIGFEYMSNAWVRDTVTTPGTTIKKTSFTLDTDTCCFPDRLMVAGLKLRYFQIKGFDVGGIGQRGSLLDEFQMQLDIAKANDAGARTLSMAPRPSNVLINWNQIPDSNYGS